MSVATRRPRDARPPRVAGQAMIVTEPPLARRWQLVIAILFIAGCLVGLPSVYGLFWFVPFGAVGALLMVRRPHTSIGWILFGLAWCFVVLTASVDATVQQFADGSVSLLTSVYAVVQSSAGSAAFYLFGLLAFVYPSGRLPGGRWGAVGRIALGICLLLVAASVVMPVISVNVAGASGSVPVPNPFALWPDAAIWKSLADWQLVTPDTVIIPTLLLVLAGAISLIVRGRRAYGVERQQLHWLGASIAVVVVAVVSGFVLGVLVPAWTDSGLIWVPAVLAFPVVSIAVGVAVLRYRLYDIDRIISRTIAWALISGLLLAVFGIVVIALQAALDKATQGQTLAVATSTLVAFAIFQPVRRHIQSIVDRRFDRARYDGERTAAALAEQLRNQVDLDALEADVVHAVGTALRPASVGVWLRPTSPHAADTAAP